MVSDGVFRVFLDGRDLETVSRASESTIYVGNTKYLDTTAGGTSYAVLGWNNSSVNDAISQQASKFGHIDYKIWNDPNLSELATVILKNIGGKLSKVYFAGNFGA